MRKSNTTTANKGTQKATTKANISVAINNTTKEINAANVSELRGLLSAVRSTGEPVAILKIPARLMAIDSRYQTELRTKRDLGYLINNWDERKLLPLTVVPHDEEGLVYITDGQGRWKASQFIDPEKYEYLRCQVILDAPKDKEERLKYEAEQYAFQNKNVAKLTPLQKHGALRILGDKNVLILDEMQDRYGFEYTYVTGQRSEGIIGYSTLFDICKSKGKDCVDYILSICASSGFDRKTNGYANYILGMLRDMYILYANDRELTKEFLSDYLRQYEPNKFRAMAVAKYSMLDVRAVCSFYVEDLIVENLCLKQSREVVGTRLVPVKKVS